MDDKTCGTCSHGLHNIVYCETNNPNANTAGLHGAGEAACKRYSERPDSVEQVARDMYRRMTCMAHYACHNNDCECCIDADCKVKEVFGDRLEALGVEL